MTQTEQLQAGVLCVIPESGWQLNGPRSLPSPSFHANYPLACAIAIQFNQSEYSLRKFRWAIVYGLKEHSFGVLAVRIGPDNRPPIADSLPPGVEACGGLTDASDLATVRNRQICEVAAKPKKWWLVVVPLLGVPAETAKNADGYCLGLAVGGVVVARTEPFAGAREAQRAFEDAQPVLLSPNGPRQ